MRHLPPPSSQSIPEFYLIKTQFSVWYRSLFFRQGQVINILCCGILSVNLNHSTLLLSCKSTNHPSRLRAVISQPNFITKTGGMSDLAHWPQFALFQNYPLRLHSYFPSCSTDVSAEGHLSLPPTPLLTSSCAVATTQTHHSFLIVTSTEVPQGCFLCLWR